MSIKHVYFYFFTVVQQNNNTLEQLDGGFFIFLSHGISIIF